MKPYVWAISGLLILLAVAFFGVHDYQFLTVDDDSYVTGNIIVRDGLSLHGIRWAFTTLYFGNYCPLTWLSHMLDVQLFGIWAGGHHLTNLLLHACNVLLVYLFFARTTQKHLWSALIAAFFAIHPLHVEPVVWVSSRKDLLSAFFFALTVNCYATYARKPTALRYLIFSLLFIAGLLSKSALVILPFILLLIDFWPLKRSDLKRCLIEKIPLTFFSAIFVWITLIAQKSSGALGNSATASLYDKILNVFVRYAFYLEKSFWPQHLGFPSPLIHADFQSQLLSAAIIILISAITILNIRSRPQLFVGWFWFLIMLAPYSQFMQVGLQEVADRWAYLPMLGILFAFLSIFDGLPLKVVSGFMIMSLTWLTCLQVQLWKDEGTLYDHTITLSPSDPIALIYRAQYKKQQGDLAGALTDYAVSQQLSPSGHTFESISSVLTRLGHDETLPDYLPALPSSASDTQMREYGRMLSTIGSKPLAAKRYKATSGKDPQQESLELLQRAQQMRPDDTITTRHLALALIALNQIEPAFNYLKEVLQKDPRNAYVNNETGLASYKLGRSDDALEYFMKAELLNPTDERIFINIGNILTTKNRLDEALNYTDKAISVAPDYAAAHLLRASLLYAQKRMKESLESFNMTLRFDLKNAAAWNGKGVLLYAMGDPQGAIDALTHCIAIDPGLPDAYLNRGVSFLKSGNPTAGRIDLEKALQLKPDMQSAKRILEQLNH